MAFKNFPKICLFLLWLGTTRISALTQPKNCGITNVSTLGDRIVGGRAAVPGEFPWQVSLRRSKRNLSLAVGLYSQEERRTVSHSVDRVIAHENFVHETFLNDIALIRVKKPIVFNENVNSICLPPPGYDVTGIVTASGWGTIAEDGDDSIVLMTVDLPVVPQSTCNQIFGSELFSPSAMLCAGYPEGGKDTCQGDSGGPLIQRRNQSSVIVGIVSFGVGCARPGLPGVYTKVSNFIDWINANAY